MLALVPLRVSAQDTAQFGATKDAPRVYVGIYLHDISALSISEGTYKIDADMWAKWRGDFNPEEIRFANAVDFDLTGVAEESDGDWHASRWAVRGIFRGEFPVHNFPLDKQYIRIALDLPTSYGTLVPDLAGSGVSRHFSITDWSWGEDFRPIVTTERYPSDRGSISSEGRSAEIRRVAFEIELERPSAPLIVKLFLPLAILMLIVYLSLFVSPDNLQPRLTMCVTGLVACFAFQFSVNDLIPTVSYLTLANVLFIVVYVLAIVCVLSAVYGHMMVTRGRAQRAVAIQTWLRCTAPALVVGTVFAAIPKAESAPDAPAEELAQFDRPATSRDVVRIGTTAALEGFGSPAMPAIHWGLARQRSGFSYDPVYIDRIPNIDSTDQRFLSDGTLETTWRLRDDATWSDGTPMHANDILAPLDAMPDPRLESWEALSDHVVVLRWKERVTDAIRPPRIWPSSQLQAADALEDADARIAFLRNPMRPSAGPYRVTEATADKLTAERNPHFPLAPGAIGRVEIHHYATSEALADALVRGDVDVAPPNNLSSVDCARVREAGKHEALEIPGGEFTFLALPLRESPWVDSTLRRALLQAIDRQRLVDLEWPTHGAVAHAPTTSPLGEDYPYVAYAPDEARARFEAAGMLGAPVTIRHPASVPASILAQLRADLESAGLVPSFVEDAQTFRSWLRNDFSDIVLHSVRLDPDTDLYRWWGLRREDGAYVLDEPSGAWGPDEARILEQHRYALFRERRQQLRERAERAWGEKLPLVPLYFAGERIVIDRQLQGWEREPRQPFGYGIESWFFD